MLFREEAARVLDETEKASIMELTTSWTEKGIEIGRQEGREQERQLLLRMLRKRFGPMEPEWEARIGQFSFEQLGELGEALVDFTSRLDIRNWLATH